MQTVYSRVLPKHGGLIRLFTSRFWLLLSLLVSSQLSVASDSPWPQFRGPDGQGNAGSIELPTQWSETSGICWKTAIPGLGHSSPVHDRKTCWLTTAARDGTELGAVAIDLSSGALVRTVTVFTPTQVEEIHACNSYASPTPVLHNGRLYVHYGTYGTACIDTESGDVLWRNTDHEVAHQGGPGSSPILFDDLLILTLDGARRQRVVALDATDGSLRWERSRSAPKRPNPITHRAFSTPLIVTSQNSSQLISPGADQCHAYNPSTGEELWHVRYVGFSTVPRPVASESAVFFCTGFFKPELWSVGLHGNGNVTKSHLNWKFKGPVSDTPSPLYDRGMLYMISDRGIATCVDAATGQRKWVFRVGGNYSASPLMANGLIYCFSEEGLTKVLDLRQKKPRIMKTNRLEGEFMASPAIVGRDLLLRTNLALYRISGVVADE